MLPSPLPEPEPSSFSGRENPSRVRDLESDVERLLLITEALWSLLKEQHGYDEQELVRRIVQIDLRDGKLDGRVPASPPKACPKCGRTVGRRKTRCLFCGEPMIFDPFAR